MFLVSVINLIVAITDMNWEQETLESTELHKINSHIPGSLQASSPKSRLFEASMNMSREHQSGQ